MIGLLPKASFTLSLEQLCGSCLELCGRHVHRLLHLLRGCRYEVFVYVVSEALLPQHPAHQVQGGAPAACLGLLAGVAGAGRPLQLRQRPAAVRNVSAEMRQSGDVGDWRLTLQETSSEAAGHTWECRIDRRARSPRAPGCRG